MRERIIRGILRRKITDWLSSIEDKELVDLLRDNIIITGGSIASLWLNEKVSDYDVYLKTKAAVLRAAKYYVQKFAENPPPKFGNGQPTKIYVDTVYTDGERKGRRAPKTAPDDGDRVRVVVKSAGVATEEGDDSSYAYFESCPPKTAEQYLDKVMKDHEDEEINAYLDTQDMGLPSVDNKQMMDQAEAVAELIQAPGKAKYRPIFLSGNAITLANDIQLCIRFYGDATEIHKNFDFVHCTNWYDYATDTLSLNFEAVKSLAQKELKYVGSLYPMCSVIRTRKFIKRGWMINAGQFIKMMYQINDLDLHDILVLEEQLTGVDAAYFQQLIAVIKEDISRGVTVDQTYICQLIDRLF